jgi:gluconolactonase
VIERRIGLGIAEGVLVEIEIVAEGLGFAEGPVAMPNGDIVTVDVRGGRLVRTTPDGTTTDIAAPGGGPNGAAIGPDGALYVVNNGGFPWSERGGLLIPVDEHGSTRPQGFEGGWVDRIDPETGAIDRLFDGLDGERFRGPNDIVFDRSGGFWFTDLCKSDTRSADRGSLFYARPDGTGLRRVATGLLGPNGVGLSPDGTEVYVAETLTGRLLAWDVAGPGEVSGGPRILMATPNHFDSLAVEADGTVVVAAISHGLCVRRPDGEISHVEVPDFMTTNVCFAGDDLRTAYITMSGSGRLGRVRWPRPGLRLAF